MKPHKFVVIAACLLAPLSALRADHPARTAIMEIGNTSLTVVLGASPGPAEKRVTELLAERLKERAGIDLAGISDKAPLRLVIGTTMSNGKIKAFAASHKEVAALGPDGYVIAVEPEKPELHVAARATAGWWLVSAA